MPGKDGPTWADDQEARWNQRIGETLRMPDYSGTNPPGNGHYGGSGGGCGTALAGLLLAALFGSVRMNQSSDHDAAAA